MKQKHLRRQFLSNRSADSNPCLLDPRNYNTFPREIQSGTLVGRAQQNTHAQTRRKSRVAIFALWTYLPGTRNTRRRYLWSKSHHRQKIWVSINHAAKSTSTSGTRTVHITRVGSERYSSQCQNCNRRRDGSCHCTKSKKNKDKYVETMDNIIVVDVDVDDSTCPSWCSLF